MGTFRETGLRHWVWTFGALVPLAEPFPLGAFLGVGVYPGLSVSLLRELYRQGPRAYDSNHLLGELS